MDELWVHNITTGTKISLNNGSNIVYPGQIQQLLINQQEGYDLGRILMVL